MRHLVVEAASRRLADPDGINWAGVPDVVRNDQEFEDLARQLKGVELAMRESTGTRHEALGKRFDTTVARMRARWNHLTGN